jgi:hypothetical protein
MSEDKILLPAAVDKRTSVDKPLSAIFAPCGTVNEEDAREVAPSQALNVFVALYHRETINGWLPMRDIVGVESIETGCWVKD